ncbi:hypothetical protein AMECASPLE_001787 [Ameca splendens]|uniref:Uncharacterized protein n=2 Tax=Goodeidae TaxID=28758 RepID=A0ABV0YKW6_9TELE
MVVNLRMTPVCGAHASEKRRRQSVQRLRQRMAQHDSGKTLRIAESAWQGRRALPPIPPECFLLARVYLWRSPGRIYDWSTKARDSASYPIFGCLRKRESSPCPTLISIIHHKLCKGAIGRAKA